MADKFIRTTAINKILKMKARKKVIQGGSSAGKTFGIIPVLIDKAIKNPGKEISIVSETIPHLRKGALKDFLKIMRLTGRYNPNNYNKTHLTYTFSNGSYIEFFSVEDEEKARGARRTDLYINEANRVRFETYHQLQSRTSGNIYIDFNPTREFWAHEEVLQEENSELLILTYRDNEALPANVIEDFDQAIKKAEGGSNYWTNYVNVYVNGQVGSLQGVVFEDWETVESMPEEASLQGYGIDFGFSQSPFTMVAVYKMDGAYYFDEIIYQTNLTNQQTAELMIEREVDQGAIMYADYAEPKSIRELQHEGINIEPCDSKGDIREYAIRKIQGSTFYVTEDSENMIDNLQNYVWATDKTGKSTGKPKKTDDHTLDAIIYFIGTDDKYSGEY